MLTAHWYHVGDRHTDEGSVRSFDKIDLTATFSNLPVAGLTARVGVHNALDDDILYVVSLPTGPQVNRFPGRTFWVKLSYEF